jgi:hypothetical protein
MIGSRCDNCLLLLPLVRVSKNLPAIVRETDFSTQARRRRRLGSCNLCAWSCLDYPFSLTRSESQLYSLAGSLFLLISGQYFFFFFPEWFIYGGIGMAVAVMALVNILALSNVSAPYPTVRISLSLT